MATLDWNVAKYVNNVPAILLAHLAMANLPYDLFGEHMEGPSFFLPFDKPENRTIGTYYRRYSELVVGFRIIGDNTINENASD